MTSSTTSRPENSPAESCGITVEESKAILIVKLHCGCTIIESANPQLTETSLQLSRASTCKRLSHFTGTEFGWPQLADAVKATILHCDASSEKLGEPVET